MKVVKINRKSEDNGQSFEFDLGNDGRIVVYFPNTPTDYHPAGFCCGSWYGLDGSFMLSNNLANYGHGPGLAQPFTPAQVGEAFDYFWNQKVESDRQRAEQRRQEEHAAYLERKARREAKAKRQASLRGGIGNAVNPNRGLFG